jgi:transposase
VQRYQETGIVGVDKPTGRPRALSEAAVERAEELVLAKDSSGANAVAQQLVT